MLKWAHEWATEWRLESEISLVLQPSRGGGFDKSLIINIYFLGDPRSRLSRRRTEIFVQKQSVESQVLS